MKYNMAWLIFPCWRFKQFVVENWLCRIPWQYSNFSIWHLWELNFWIMQVMLVKVAKETLKDLLDPKDKRGKKDRGCLEWSTSAGGAQTAAETLRLCTQVSTLWQYWSDIVYKSRTRLIKFSNLTTNLKTNSWRYPLSSNSFCLYW